MGVRLELQSQPHGKRTYLFPACHTLSKFEKLSFCKCLWGVKVPQGYSSNIKSLVSMQDLKLMGLKSHDCHVLIQVLLQLLLVEFYQKMLDKLSLAYAYSSMLFVEKLSILIA